MNGRKRHVVRADCPDGNNACRIVVSDSRRVVLIVRIPTEKLAGVDT